MCIFREHMPRSKKVDEATKIEQRLLGLEHWALYRHWQAISPMLSADREVSYQNRPLECAWATVRSQNQVHRSPRRRKEKSEKREVTNYPPLAAPLLGHSLSIWISALMIVRKVRYDIKVAGLWKKSFIIVIRTLWAIRDDTINNLSALIRSILILSNKAKAKELRGVHRICQLIGGRKNNS